MKRTPYFFKGSCFLYDFSLQPHVASYIRCFLKQYICLVTYLLSGHFIIYYVQTAYIVHITCESERARKASTPGVERARAFKYFNNLMREMRTVSTTFRFIKKRKKRRKKRIESEERFILGSSKNTGLKDTQLSDAPLTNTTTTIYGNAGRGAGSEELLSTHLQIMCCCLKMIACHSQLDSYMRGFTE